MHPLRSGDPLSPNESWYSWEEEESGASWLLSYVDMLSVMLALMVVLLGHMAAQHMASARPEQPVAVSTAESGAHVAMPPAAHDSTAVVAHADTVPMSLASSPQLVELRPIIAPLPSEATPTTPTTSSSEAMARLTTAVEQRLAGLVQPIQREHGVSLAISEAILFESGQAKLREEARPLLTQLVTALQEAGDAQVEVEGHTDSRPIHSGRYESNWELAAARATAVTRFLIEQGFPSYRLRSVSYADTRPATNESSPDGYAQNRRVNLMVEFPSPAPEFAASDELGSVNITH